MEEIEEEMNQKTDQYTEQKRGDDEHISNLEMELARQETEREDAKKAREKHEREKELEHYRKVEEERVKWEDRETRLKSVNRQLCEFKEKGVITDVTSLREELVVSTQQTEELKSSVEAKHLENDELRAEITWLKTRLKRVERETPVCESVGLEESSPIRKTTGIEKPLSMTGSSESGRSKAIVPASLTPLLITPYLQILRGRAT